MKKSNRITRKSDSAARGAQAKHPAGKPWESKAAKERMPLISKYGAEIVAVEIEPFGRQSLHRQGEKYTLVRETVDVCIAGDWWGLENWNELHPEFKPDGIPAANFRTYHGCECMTRKGAVAWLFENISFITIPDEFREDFRPRGIVPDSGPLREIESPDGFAAFVAFIGEEIATCFEYGCRVSIVKRGAFFYNAVEALGLPFAGEFVSPEEIAGERGAEYLANLFRTTPAAEIKRNYDFEPLPRNEVLQWMWKHLITRCIPEEFHADFYPTFEPALATA